MIVELPVELLHYIYLASEMRTALDQMDPEHIGLSMECDLDDTLQKIGELTVELVNKTRREGITNVR